MVLIQYVIVNLQDFYEDMFEELNKYGEIESLNVCDNLSDHLVSGIFELLAKHSLIVCFLDSNHNNFSIFFGRLVMCMCSFEKKNKQEMRFAIFKEDSMQVDYDFNALFGV